MKKFYIIPTYLILLLVLEFDHVVTDAIAVILAIVQSIMIAVFTFKSRKDRRLRIANFSLIGAAINDKIDREQTEADLDLDVQLAEEHEEKMEQYRDYYEKIEANVSRYWEKAEAEVILYCKEERDKVDTYCKTKRAEADTYYEHRKSEADSYYHQRMEQAHIESENVARKSREKIDEIFSSAHKKADDILTEAYHKAEKAPELVEQREEEIIRAAKSEAEQILAQARTEAGKIVADADEIAKKKVEIATAETDALRTKAKEECHSLQKIGVEQYQNAYKQAQQLVNDSKKEASSIIKDAEKKRLEIIKGKLESNIPKSIFLTTKWELLQPIEQAELTAIFVHSVLNIESPEDENIDFANEILDQNFSEYLKHSLKNIDDFEGDAFEQYCAMLLESCGFCNVIVTQYSGDYGVDIMAEKNYVTYAVQCKRHKNTVGTDAVREIYTAKEYFKKSIGVVLTNSSYTSSAIKMAKETGIHLWDRRMLCKMIRIKWMRDIIGV